MTGISYAADNKSLPGGTHLIASSDIATATELWERLLHETDFQSRIVDAARDIVEGQSRRKAREVIAEITDATLSAPLPIVLPSLGLSDDSGAFWDALRSLRGLISGRTLGLTAGVDTIAQLGRIINAGPDEPTVAIAVPDRIRDVAADTRRNWCQVVAGLAIGCDVRLLCSRVDAAWLAEHHRDELPGVSEWNTSPPSEEALAAAATEINVGSRQARLLRHLATIDTRSATYHELTAAFTVSRSRIRQVVSELADTDLVSIYGSPQTRKVELTQTGHEFYETEIAPQQRLSAAVSDTPNLSNNSRVSNAGAREGETATGDSTRDCDGTATADSNSTATADSNSTATANRDGTATASSSAKKTSSTFSPKDYPTSPQTTPETSNSTQTEPTPAPEQATLETHISPDRHRLSRQHQTRYVSKSNTVLYSAVNVDRGISLVDYPVDAQSDRGEGRFTFENDATLYVSAEADNPLQVWTTLALTLAAERTFQEVLTRKRLEEHDVVDMLADAPTIIHSMRNLGWIDETVDNYPDLKKTLRDAAAELRTLSGYAATDDSRRGETLRHALGLAGVITHLLDLVDVELVRVLKLPDFTKRFNASGSRAAAIWETIAIGTAIGARYRHHVAYRQLFETREQKRDQAFDVTVDAADPTALDIGSWALIGDFAGQLEAVKDGLTEAFADLEPHEDAPPIQIEDTIQTQPTRRQVAVVTSQTLAWKGLTPTDEAVSLLHGLCRSLGDVRDALAHLGGTNDGRRIDAAEVRYALAQLDAHRLLRGFTPSTTTPRNLVAALLRADAPLQKSTLDTKAGVSAPSRRTYLSDLITTGLVTETDDGIRLALSFDGTGDGEYDERLSDRYPTLVSHADHTAVHMAAKVLQIGRDHHGPDGPATDVGWPYGTAAPPPDLRELDQPAVYLDSVLPALWGIAMEETYREETALRPSPKTTITAGPAQRQSALVWFSD
jgi:predicted transcriptional regulator